MAHIHLLTAFLDELDDMETELRLHNLRYLLRVGEVEGHRREGGIKGTTSHQTEFTATTGRTWIFGVETCQCLERCLTLVHSVGVVTELVFHTVQFLRFDTWGLLDDLHLHLCRYEGDTVLWHVPEITTYLGRCHGDILNEFPFHLLYHLTVFHLVT